ncbi:hypothetical protein GRF29_216g413566 [Pseudopithomyces chartarum]|uniref:BZIP domain-containing protein n=1 Tax=Pseudopithomyces chartarum TaxID=1892770 RepID=A0AAN6LMP7_9PLEO|nr:hypothetical protein GRF29_216g413566 [Pseudopithomyces chartarum]
MGGWARWACMRSHCWDAPPVAAAGRLMGGMEEFSRGGLSGALAPAVLLAYWLWHWAPRPPVRRSACLPVIRTPTALSRRLAPCVLARDAEPCAGPFEIAAAPASDGLSFPLHKVLPHSICARPPTAPVAALLSAIINTIHTHVQISDPALWLSLQRPLSLPEPLPGHLIHQPVASEEAWQMTATVGKTEASRDAETPSTASSPEPEPAAYAQDTTQQQQKRKGGRKPVSYYPACETSKTMPTMTLTPRKIYATSEERKQRNRQAQAAFRERRTEYIKQLESTIKHHEDTLQNLQQSHRSAADECLMLRYKNSLLERILLEKGIDVQAELQAKTGSPNLGPTRQSASTTASPNQPPLQQRAMLNRQQQNRRSLGGVPNKVEGVHEQEYDEQNDMLDQEEPSDHSAGPGPYPHPFPSNSMQSQSMQPPMPPAQNAPFANNNAMSANDGSHAFNGMNNLFDPYDPMLDADPFGLSASMHFPTMYESR